MIDRDVFSVRAMRLKAAAGTPVRHGDRRGPGPSSLTQLNCGGPVGLPNRVSSTAGRASSGTQPDILLVSDYITSYLKSSPLPPGERGLRFVLLE